MHKRLSHVIGHTSSIWSIAKGCSYGNPKLDSARSGESSVNANADGIPAGGNVSLRARSQEARWSVNG